MSAPSTARSPDHAARPWSTVTALVLVPLFGAMLIGVLWWAVLDKLAGEERLIIERALRESESIAAEFEIQALRAIRDADRTTLLIKHLVERDGAVDLMGLAHDGLIPSDLYLLTSVVDASGHVVASSEPRAIGIDVSERDYFRRHESGDSGALDISKPTTLRVSGRPTIQLSRRLNTADGTFAGIVVLAVDPAFFTTFSGDGLLGTSGVLGLLGIDGTYRARRVGRQPVSAVEGSGVILAKVAAAPIGSYEGKSPLDGITRLVAYRKLRDFPLVVMAARSKQEALADFARARSVYLAGAAAVSLLIALLFGTTTVLTYRLKRSQARAWARANELRLASAVFESTTDAIIISDPDDRIVMVNAAFTQLTGFAPEEVVGKTVAASPFRPIDPAEAAARQARWQRDGHVSGEVVRRRRDGKALQLWITATCVYDERGGVVNRVRVFTDISALKESQRRVEQLARCDALTGLANRHVFHEELDKALKRADRSQSGVALLYLDLDGFKDINDTFGHDAGDLVLRETAVRLTSCVRDVDIVSRIGGDEFTLVLAECSTGDGAVAVAERVLTQIEAPIDIGGTLRRVTASIGIARYPQDGCSAHVLLKNADQAMYAAKQAKRARHDSCIAAETSDHQPRRS